MNKRDISNLLLRFSIKNQCLVSFFHGKKIIENNKNIFLSDKDFSKNQVYNDMLLFINLRNGLIPSSFFLNWIEKSTENKIFLKNRKAMIDFTYGKNISLNSIENTKKNISNQNYYMVIFDNMILGYCSFDKKNSNLKNIMNIGSYLFEN